MGRTQQHGGSRMTTFRAMFGLADRREAEKVVWRRQLTLFGSGERKKSEKEAEPVVEEELPSPDAEGEVRTAHARGVVPDRINFGMAVNSAVKLNIDFNALSDADYQKRREAVTRLGTLYLGWHAGEFNEDAAEIVMPALRAAMRDEHWEVRARAATSLSELGPEAVWHAVPVLWEACSDPEDPVRHAALRALQAHGQEAPPERSQQPRMRTRPWHSPPSMGSLREESQEDCQSECSLTQESSTTAASNEGSRQSSCPSSHSGPVPTSEFTMSLAHPPGSWLGLHVAYTQKDTLKVMGIQDGLVNNWNRQQVVWRVEAGDRIISVNGETGSAEELMDRLQDSTWLEVVVSRQVVSSGEYLSI